MARVLQVTFEFKPYRDADKRLARAYELLAPLDRARQQQTICGESLGADQEEETKNEASEFIRQSID